MAWTTEFMVSVKCEISFENSLVLTSPEVGRHPAKRIESTSAHMKCNRASPESWNRKVLPHFLTASLSDHREARLSIAVATRYILHKIFVRKEQQRYINNPIHNKQNE